MAKNKPNLNLSSSFQLWLAPPPLSCPVTLCPFKDRGKILKTLDKLDVS